jgi:hypothetical protein
MTDITETLAPNSDQLDAVDLLTGPRTFTVERVVVNKSDQPVNVHLRDFPRVWRPGKNMRRVLASLWGSDSAGWTGRSVTLYCDKTVQFGGQTVGGIRISHMSHIDGVQKASIIPTRGKSALWTVQPLADAPAAEPVPTEADVQASTDTETLRRWWKHTHLQPAIKARVDELKAEKDAGADAVAPGLFERGE